MTRCYKAKAFTILESITALVILTISVSAVIFSIRVSYRAAVLSCQKNNAIHLAESLLVEQKAANIRQYKTIKDQHDGFEYTINLAPTEVEDLASVVVNVSWLNQGIKQTVELQSFLYIEPIKQE